MSNHPSSAPGLPPLLTAPAASTSIANKGDNKRSADGAFKNAVDAISRLKQANIADMQPMPATTVIATTAASTNVNDVATTAGVANSRPAAGPTRTKKAGSSASKQRMSFSERIEELKAYGEKYGTVNVPQTCKINPSLGRWCHNMKYVYKRKMEGKSLKGYLNMTDEQAQELKDLGFEFAMADHTPRKSFQERLVELQAFIDANGHANVPSNYAQDPSLGHWASDVRRGSYSLTSEQIETLTGMGFEFAVKSRAPNKSFEERLEECKEYAKIHGHPNVPQGYKHNPLLGQWCDQIRKSYAKAMGNNGAGVKGLRLTAPKIQALKDIGFDFHYKTVDRKTYEERIAEIKEYAEKHGHANIPPTYKENPGLGMWVANLRSSYKRFQKNKQNYKGLQFTEERLQQLRDVGFDFDLKCGKTFEDRLEELKEYKAKHGDVHVSQKYKGNPSLGSWCANMRTAYRRKKEGKPTLFKMTDERIKILEDMGFEFSVRPTNQSKSTTVDKADIDAAIDVAVATDIGQVPSGIEDVPTSNGAEDRTTQGYKEENVGDVTAESHIMV